MSDVLYQMHPSPITLWGAILIFILFVLSTENKVLAKSLENMTVSQGSLIHVDLQNTSHYDSLILPNTFLCNFFLVF